MGLYPDLLPGYPPVSEGIAFRERWDAQFPTEQGLNLLQILEACKDGLLRALYVVGSNPLDRYYVDPFALRPPFLVVQDLFLTETAQFANVVLPATSAYEKSGTFTNTCGDLAPPCALDSDASIAPIPTACRRAARSSGTRLRHNSRLPEVP